MRLHELTERGQGADGASELSKRKYDPRSPQNKNKLKQKNLIKSNHTLI